MNNVAHETSLQSLQSVRPLQGWEGFLEDGNSYLRTAGAAHRNGNEIFTPDILYNLVAMAIEKFVMAALMRHGTLPCNHTMADLVEAMEQVFPGALATMREGLLNLDGYQDICDPYAFVITTPAREDIPGMLELAGKLQQLVAGELAVEA